MAWNRASACVMRRLTVAAEIPIVRAISSTVIRSR